MINLTLTVLIILIIVGIIAGFRMGFVKGLSHLVALVVVLITLSVVSMLAESFRGGQAKNTIMSLIVLVILGTVYGLIKWMFRSLKAMIKLPILDILDKIFGIPLGIIWVMLLSMTIFTLAYLGYLGSISNYIMNDITNNKILTIMTLYNPLM